MRKLWEWIGTRMGWDKDSHGKGTTQKTAEKVLITGEDTGLDYLCMKCGESSRSGIVTASIYFCSKCLGPIIQKLEELVSGKEPNV